MRKRERENPCFVCGHYHKFEDGEVCGICGHRQKEATEKGPQQSAFSNEILPQFLYLGSYDNASRAELLKAQGISRILNVHTHTCMHDDALFLKALRCFQIGYQN
jgi:dual specificity MAP kinase phosphatase